MNASFEEEDLVDASSQLVRELKGQQRRGHIQAGFDGADGLPRDADETRELLLGQVSLGARDSQTICQPRGHVRMVDLGWQGCRPV